MITTVTRDVLKLVFPKKQLILLGVTCAFFILLAVSLIVFDGFFTDFLYRPDTILASTSPGESGATYSYFSLGHILMVVVTMFLFAGTAFLFYKKKKFMNVAFIIAAVTVLLCSGGLLIYSIQTGVYKLEWYMPVHICNFFIVLLPLCLVFKKKFRGFFMDYVVIAGIVGCILATVFPMTTMLTYPPYHIVPILCWIHHLAIGLLGVYLIASGNYTRFRWFNCACVVWGLVFCSMLVNYFFGTNFIFLNTAKAAAPITWFQFVLGKHAVFIMLGILTFVAFAIQITLDLYHNIKRFTIRDVVLWVRVQIEKFQIEINSNKDLRENLAYISESVVKSMATIRKTLFSDYTINKMKKRTSDFLNLLTPEEISFFMDTPIEQLADPVYFYARLKELGTVERFQKFSRSFRYLKSNLERIDNAAINKI